jgi:transcription-repair coupling factor (superfamily II helicase)
MAEDLREYIKGLRSLDKFRSVAKAVQTGKTFHVGGLFGSAPALFLSALRRDVKGTYLVACPGLREARTVHDDLLHFFDRDEVAVFPPWEGRGDEVREEDTETFARRLGILCRFVGGKPPAAVVAPVQALAQEVVPPEAVEKNTRWIRVGEELDTDAFLPWLEGRDLRRVPMAETNGEWSRRGAILDVFPFSSPRPFRVELFGDTVESIREYDPATQVSVRKLRECRVTLIRKRRFQKPGQGRAASLLDYLPKRSLCVYHEPERIEARVSEIFQRTDDARTPLAWSGFLEASGRFARLFVSSLPHEAGAEGVDFTIRSVHRATPGIQGVLEGFREIIKKKHF